jgi:hypothetical protein
VKNIEQKPDINSLILSSRFDFSVETPSSLKRKTLKLSLKSFILGMFIGAIVLGVFEVGLYRILRNESSGRLALRSKLSQNLPTYPIFHVTTP